MPTRASSLAQAVSQLDGRHTKSGKIRSTKERSIFERAALDFRGRQFSWQLKKAGYQSICTGTSTDRVSGLI